MSDLHCPVRVHLGDEPPTGEKVALVIEGEETPLDDLVDQLAEAADGYRGEAVWVRSGEGVRAAVVRRLTGQDSGALALEGDADGWRISHQ